jgi:uncharacterized membrane protein YbhN (UPF0104 family)
MGERATSHPETIDGGASRRRTLVSLVVAVLLGAGVWFLIGQATSYSQLVSAVRRANPWWLTGALFGLIISYLGYALLYQSLCTLRRGPRPPLRLIVRLTVAVFGASVIATAAGRLGSEYWSLRRMREPAPRAWARVLAINTAAWALLAALACAGALALLLGAGGSVPLGVELAWLLTLPACLVPAMYLSAPARRHLAEDRGGRVRRTAASVISALVLLRQLGSSREHGARGLGGGLLYWTGELLISWCALRAFGAHLGLPALLIAYATGFVSTMLPLPAGGAGGVDAATTFAFTLVGVPLSLALLATLAQRVFSYWLPIVIAMLAARSIRRLGGDLSALAPGRSLAWSAGRLQPGYLEVSSKCTR